MNEYPESRLSGYSFICVRIHICDSFICVSNSPRVACDSLVSGYHITPETHLGYQRGTMSLDVVPRIQRHHVACDSQATWCLSSDMVPLSYHVAVKLCVRDGASYPQAPCRLRLRERSRMHVATGASGYEISLSRIHRHHVACDSLVCPQEPLLMSLVTDEN